MDQGYLQENFSYPAQWDSRRIKIDNPKHIETKPKGKISNENVSIKVNISTSSSMELSKDGLDYLGLRSFIERLEGLLC